MSNWFIVCRAEKWGIIGLINDTLNYVISWRTYVFRDSNECTDIFI